MHYSWILKSFRNWMKNNYEIRLVLHWVILFINIHLSTYIYCAIKFSMPADWVHFKRAKNITAKMNCCSAVVAEYTRVFMNYKLCVLFPIVGTLSIRVSLNQANTILWEAVDFSIQLLLLKQTMKLQKYI